MNSPAFEEGGGAGGGENTVFSTTTCVNTPDSSLTGAGDGAGGAEAGGVEAAGFCSAWNISVNPLEVLAGAGGSGAAGGVTGFHWVSSVGGDGAPWLPSSDLRMSSSCGCAAFG